MKALRRFAAWVRDRAAAAQARWTRQAPPALSLPELAFSPAEVEEILQIVNGRAVLIGSQALAFWMQYYGITSQELPRADIARNIDFLHNKRAVRVLSETLEARGWHTKVLEADEQATHRLTISKQFEARGFKQIVFRSRIDELPRDTVRQRAAALVHEGAWMHILHPLDVLESRLRRLVSFATPPEPDPRSVEHARLALEVVRRHIEQAIAGEWLDRLEGAVEQVLLLAEDESLEEVFLTYALNPLGIFPEELPQELARLRQKRDETEENEGW